MPPPLHLTFALFDKSGQCLARQTGDRVATRDFAKTPEQVGPFQMLIIAHTVTKDIELPFDLRNVPIE